jgi:hypothetical protein
MSTNETKSLAVQTDTPKGILTREALKAESEQRQLLAEYVRGQMKEGVDYGKIPGTDKDTLLKPGAEKLVDLFRCTPKFHLVKIEEDFEKGHFNYVFRVRLYQRDADAVLAEGFGSANSKEGRYRWREAQRKCPNCQKPTIFASKLEPGFYCWAKKGGCGAKYKADEARITSQPAGRVENDDVATLANTILKMAKKRALVDGAIALARCSDMFTQDTEDLERDSGFTADEPPLPVPPPRSTAPAQSRTEAAKEKVKARLQVVDVKAGETEAQATVRTAGELAPFERIQVLAREYAVDGFTMASIIKGCTGKENRTQVTPEDVAKVATALQMRAERLTREAQQPQPEQF